ncbi:MAG: SCO family protein [Thermomicrobium sp.]|nr:SCO family protein [Thermomicrobium sp.]MDW7982985.1 SCO family protein [Thermomicrobium sp.]
MVRRLALALVLAAAVLSILWSALAAPRVLPRLRLAPGFGLMDATGRPVSSDALRGRTVLVTFGPVRCDERCQGWSRAVATAIPSRISGEAVQLVWIAAEPASPEELARLQATLPPAPLPWRVLGSRDDRQIELVLSGFRVPRHSDGTASAVDPVLVVVDPTGIVRAEYRVAPPGSVLDGDLAALEREIRDSRGLRRYLYEAAHLFSCNVGGA